MQSPINQAILSILDKMQNLANKNLYEKYMQIDTATPSKLLLYFL